MAKIKYTRVSDLIRMPKPRMLVEGILPQRGLMMLMSHSGAGKTWFALEVALAVATGRPAFGKFVVPVKGRVWYIGEDAPDWDVGAQMRKLMWQKGIDAEELDREWAVLEDGSVDPESGPQVVPTVGTGALFDDKEWVEEALRFVKDNDVKLVIVDTLAETNRQDENDNGAMKMIAKRMKLLRDAGACVLVLHHLAKPNAQGPARVGTTGARGASAFGAACDVALLLQQRYGRVEVKIAKQRAMRLTEFKYMLVGDDDEMELQVLEEAPQATEAILKVLLGAGEVGAARAAMLTAIRKEDSEVSEAALAQRWWTAMQRLLAEGRVRKLRRGVYGLTDKARAELQGQDAKDLSGL